MKTLILQRLSEIESRYDVKILLAVESGSRAWGFASKDSDYDVRFVYVHRKEWYLSLVEGRDVIEELDSDGVMDFAGWSDKVFDVLNAVENGAEVLDKIKVIEI